MRILLPIFILLIIANSAQAGVLLDFDYIMFQETGTTETSSSSVKNYYSGGLLVSVDSKRKFNLGAYVIGVSTNEEIFGKTAAFTTQDIVLGFRWEMDRAKVWSISGGYGILAKGAYSEGDGAEEWQGTSLFGKISMLPAISESLNLGVSLVYYQAVFSSKTINQTTTSVSYAKGLLMPTLSLAWRW